MHIVYAIPYYRPARAFGGPVTICSELAEAMGRRGHTVTVVTTDAASRTDRVSVVRERIDGVDVVRTRNFSQLAVGQNLFMPIGMASAMEALMLRADVVHVYEFFNWVSYRAVEKAARRSVPVVLTPQGGLSTAPERGRASLKKVPLRMLGGATLQRCRAVQTVTRAEADVCRGLGVPEEKLRIIPNGVPGPPRGGDAARFRRQYRIPDRPIVLFVGRLLSPKGVDLLLNAAPKFAGDAGLVFVLAGPPENRADLGSGWKSDNVLLTGLLDREGLDDAYRAASMFVLPSVSEGLPMSALDALAFGVPILSHACNLPDVEEAGAGVLIEPAQTAVEAAVAGLMSRRAEWPAMREAAMSLVRDRYDLVHVHDQFELLYRELTHAA